jgi:opacity protein-like surface antigen
MKKYRILVAAVMLVVFLALVIAPAMAQLVIADRELRVVKVDPERRRIEIAAASTSNPDRTTGYIYISHKTKTYMNKDSFPWENLQKGWIIRVRGGVRIDMNVNAERIWVIEKN